MIEKMKVVHIVAAASEKQRCWISCGSWALSTSRKRPAPIKGIWSALPGCPAWR